MRRSDFLKLLSGLPFVQKIKFEPKIKEVPPVIHELEHFTGVGWSGIFFPVKIKKEDEQSIKM